AVHRSRSPRREAAAYPQPVRGALSSRASTTAALHRVAMTCAQIAIMPKNNANEASVAASSTRARTMITTPHRQEQDMNIVHAMFAVKWEFSMAPARLEIARSAGPSVVPLPTTTALASALLCCLQGFSQLN